MKLKSIGSRVNCGHNKLANYVDVFLHQVHVAHVVAKNATSRFHKGILKSYLSKLDVIQVQLHADAYV